MSLSKGSREVIERIVTERIEQGLGESEGIPFALSNEEPSPEAESSAEVAAEHIEPSAPPPNSTAADEPLSVDAPLSVDELDSSQVDVRAALDRARALIGAGDTDQELDSLFRVSAAPVAETVDEASHELAAMLGGQAIAARRPELTRDPPTDLTDLADIEERALRAEEESAPRTAPADEAAQEVADDAPAPEAEPEQAVDDALDALDESEEETAVREPEPALEAALDSLESDEAPEEAADAPAKDDDVIELDLLEDEDVEIYGEESTTSFPSGVDVGVLDPGGLEDNGIHDLSKPGTGPIDLSKLADLPSSHLLDDDEDAESEAELDLPEGPRH